MMLLNDKYVAELSKVLNKRLKSLQAPFYVVCNASNTRNRINETWRRAASRQCDADYKNVRNVSEREVNEWLLKNRGISLKKLRKGDLKAASIPKKTKVVELKAKPKPKAKPAPKPKAKPAPKPKAKPTPKPKAKAEMRADLLKKLKIEAKVYGNADFFVKTMQEENLPKMERLAKDEFYEHRDKAKEFVKILKNTKLLKDIWNKNNPMLASVKNAPRRPAGELLAINETPQKTNNSDGNWAVNTVISTGKLGNGRMESTEYFWHKKDAEAWIAARKKKLVIPKASPIEVSKIKAIEKHYRKINAIDGTYVVKVMMANGEVKERKYWNEFDAKWFIKQHKHLPSIYEYKKKLKTSKPEAKPAPKPEAKPAPKPKAKPAPEPKAKPKTETKAKPKTETKKQQETKLTEKGKKILEHQLKLLLPYSETDENYPAMSRAVYFDKYGATATDGTQLAHIYIGHNKIEGIYTKEKTKLTGKFPAYTKILPSNTKNIATIKLSDIQKFNFVDKITKRFTKFWDFKYRPFKMITDSKEVIYVSFDKLYSGIKFINYWKEGDVSLFKSSNMAENIMAIYHSSLNKIEDLLKLPYFYLMMPLRDIAEKESPTLNQQRVNEFYDKFRNDMYKVVPDNPSIYYLIELWDRTDLKYKWESRKLIINPKDWHPIFVLESDYEGTLTTDWKYPYTRSFRSPEADINSKMMNMEAGKIHFTYKMNDFDFKSFKIGREPFFNIADYYLEKRKFFTAVRVLKRLGAEKISIGSIKIDNINYLTIKSNDKIAYIIAGLADSKYGDSLNKYLKKR